MNQYNTGTLSNYGSSTVYNSGILDFNSSRKHYFYELYQNMMIMFDISYSDATDILDLINPYNTNKSDEEYSKNLKLASSLFFTAVVEHIKKGVIKELKENK